MGYDTILIFYGPPPPPPMLKLQQIIHTNNSLGRDISREYCLSMGPVYSKIFLNLNYTLNWINHFTSFISFASKHVYLKKNQIIYIICRIVRFRLLYKYMHTFVRIHWFVNFCCNRKQ